MQLGPIGLLCSIIIIIIIIILLKSGDEAHRHKHQHTPKQNFLYCLYDCIFV